MAQVPLTVRFLAEKDSSFDTVAGSVQKQVSELQTAAKAPGASKEERQTLRQATELVAKLNGELTRVKAGAEAAAAALGRLKPPAAAGAPSSAPGGSSGRGGKSVPAGIGEDAKRASEQLAEMNRLLQASATAGAGADRLQSLRSGALELQKWQLQNQQLLAAVPQLRQQYGQVAGQLRVAAAEARELASAEAKVATEAARVANEQKRAAEAAQRHSAQQAIAEQKRLAEEAERASKATRDSLGGVADLARGAGVLVTTAGAALTGLGVVAVKTASEFEQLQARLSAVVRNGAQAQALFQQAVAYAATTPFDVGGIVKATVILASFQQSATRALPAVANLAAGMGWSVERAAEIMGKALSGSLEGFESLRNEAGITNADLKRAGASLTEMGTISTRSARDIDLAGKALLKIVSNRFGDAAAAQSRTLQGSMSNAGDAIQRVGAAYGKDLVPFARVASEAMQSFAATLEQLPGPVRAFIAVGGGAAGALGVLGGGALLAGGNILSLGLQLVDLKNKLPKQALDTVNAQLGNFANTAKSAANSRLGQFFLGATPYIAGFTAALVVGEAALALYLDRLKELDKDVVDAGKAVSDAYRPTREYSKLLNQAAGGNFVSNSKDVAQVTKEVGAAFKAMPLADLIGNLEKAGVTLGDLRKELEANAASTKDLEEKQRLLQKLIKETPRTKPLTNREGDVIGEQENRLSIPPELRGFFNGEATASFEAATKQVNGFNDALNSLRSGAVVLTSIKQGFESFQEPLAKTLEQSRKLDGYFQFAGRAKDILTIRQNIVDLMNEIEKFNSEAKPKGIPIDEAGLIQRLKTVQPGTERDFDEKFLERIHQLKEAQKAELEYNRAVEEEQVKQLDRRRAVAKGESDVSLDGKRKELQAERTYLEQRLALVKGNVAREVELTKKLNELRKQKPSGAREALIESIQEQLKIVREGADEEIKTKEDLRKNKKALLEEDVSDAKRALDEQLKAGLEFIKKLKDQGAGSPEILKAFDRIQIRLDTWKKTNKDILAQTPALKAQLEAARRQAESEERGQRKADRSENLRKLTGQLGEDLATENNLLTKQKLVKDAIATIDSRIRANQIDRKEGEFAILQLQKQQADLGRQIEAQQFRNAQERLGIQRSGLDQEIALLEQQRAAGANVNNQLQEARRERLQFALDAIALEAEAEKKAGVDAEQVAFKKKAAVEQLLRGEYMAQLQKFQDEERAAEEHERKLDDIRNGRFGGKNSPLQSIEEAFAGGDSFSLGDFSLDRFRRPRRQAPSPLTFAAQQGLDPGLSRQLSDSVRDAQFRQRSVRPVSLPGSPALSATRSQFLAIDRELAGLNTATREGAERAAELRARRQALSVPGSQELNDLVQRGRRELAPPELSGTARSTRQTSSSDHEKTHQAARGGDTYNTTVNGNKMGDREIESLVMRILEKAYRATKHKGNPR